MFVRQLALSPIQHNNKNTRLHNVSACFLVRPGDSNLWPLESENCDIWQNVMIQRENLCGAHKFPRCL